MIKKCEWCRKTFQCDSRKKYCCEECRRLGKNEYARLYNKEYRKQLQKRNKSCKRKDCLYHAPKHSQNACDFCYLTGELRNCEKGNKCTRYITSTEEEKQKFRELMMQKIDD